MEWLDNRICAMQTKWKGRTNREKLRIYLFVYTVAFGVLFLLAYSPFWMAEKSFIFEGDGQYQHYTLLVYIGRYLRQIVLNFLHGDFFIPLFDLNLAMGADIISTLNECGFGDPLDMMSVFVPTSEMECLFHFLVVLRLYLAGLSFSALCIYRKKRLSHTWVGAFVFIFSGFALFSAVRHPHFITPMIQMPLLIIGMDQVMRKKSPYLFVAAVFYSAMCGYYFLYMMTIALGVYFLVKFAEYVPTSRLQNFFGIAGRVAKAYLWGIGLSAALFLPSVLGFLESGRAGEIVERNYISYGWDYYRRNLMRLIAPPASWDALCMAAITLLAVVLLFTKKKENRNLKIFLVIGTTVYLLPFGGYIMNGFGYPTQRWSFLLALLLALVVVEMLPDLLNPSPKHIVVCCFAVIAYSVAVFANEKLRNGFYVVAVAMLAMTLLTMLLPMVCFPRVRRRSTMCILFVFLMLMGNISVNALYLFASDQNGYINSFRQYGKETESLENSLERKAEPYLYKQEGRFESASFTPNRGMVWRVPNMYSYWSIMNRYICDFGRLTENSSQRAMSFRFWGMDQRTISNALFSTKYYVEKNEKMQYKPYGYHLIEETSDECGVYENNYALPWGYTYSSYILHSTLDKMNGLQREEAMLQSIVLETDEPDYPVGDLKSSVQKIPYKIVRMDHLTWTNDVLEVSKDNSVILLEFDLPQNTEAYLRIEGLNINQSKVSEFAVTTQMDSVKKTAGVCSSSFNWYTGVENYLMNMGYSEEERTSCAITFPKKYSSIRFADGQLFGAGGSPAGGAAGKHRIFYK